MSIENLEIAVKDLIRRVNNMIRPGRIIAVKADKALVQVRFSEGDPDAGIPPFDSGWLPVFQQRAAKSIEWDFPAVGEQVMVFAPGGELTGGYVGFALYSTDNPAPSNKPATRLRKYPDGTAVSYDSETNTLSIDGGDMLIIQTKGKRIEFNAEKVAIKNAAGDEVIGLVSKGLKEVETSTTVTMMGPQKLLPAATNMPQITQKLDSFGG
jgi:phage baseplate assembly protein V